MQNRLIDLVEQKQIRKDLTAFDVGNIIKVYVKIREGEKQRIQIFEGLVIAKKSTASNETFTVRKISYGIGVERTFFLNSNIISKIEVVKENKIRRAKLYYIRNLKGKKARLKEKIKKNKAKINID